MNQNIYDYIALVAANSDLVFRRLLDSPWCHGHSAYRPAQRGKSQSASQNDARGKGAARPGAKLMNAAVAHGAISGAAAGWYTAGRPLTGAGVGAACAVFVWASDALLGRVLGLG
jgi:hypothetical protein